jgi:hypothetical protein
MCRVFMHAWDYVDVQRDGRVYIQSLRCIRCSTMKFVRIDSRTGDTVTTWYQHVDGYLFTKGGHMTPDERRSVRLREVKTNLKGQG